MSGADNERPDRSGEDADPHKSPAQQRPHEAFGRMPERQRIVAAAAFLVVCLCLAWLLLPFGVDVDGDHVTCGSPLTPAQFDPEDRAHPLCADIASGRQVVAGAVVVVAVAGAFVVRTLMNRRARRDGSGAT